MQFIICFVYYLIRLHSMNCHIGDNVRGEIKTKVQWANETKIVQVIYTKFCIF
jgi:hypothetical protein